MSMLHNQAHVVNAAYRAQWQAATAVAIQQNLRDGMIVQRNLRDTIAVQKNLHGMIAIQQNLRDTIAIQQNLRDTVAVQQNLRDTIAIQQNLRDTVAVQQNLHDTIAIQQNLRDTVAVQLNLRGDGAANNEAPQVLNIPPILLQAVIEVGDRANEGQLVRAVALPWLEIVRRMRQDPRLIYELDWRKWEELVAGAWKNAGYDVILTPRSGDGGRDVIATLPGAGRIRLFDQVKRYGPDHLVTADEVRSMIGVLTAEGNVSKGFITTTSQFAPGIEKDVGIQGLTPYRIELRPREPLLAWLGELANESR
jgi:restriction system protein